MCGVAGVFRTGGGAPAEAGVRAMMSAIRHRGPDDEGLWAEGSMMLGHLRLSILDLSRNAAQPMISHDGRYVLSYNGEIFNFRDLRRKLERMGARFRSTGDTEVLLEYLARCGVETALSGIEGDFAFAVWDRRDQRLVLARDRHGIKPMYYTQGTGQDVYFASEVKALLPTGLTPDFATLSTCLLGLSATWGDRTMFREVRSVLPGEWLEFTAGSTSPVRRRFFSLTEFADESLYRELARAPESAVVDRVAAELKASTELRMISDAPVACLVSGGVDSSIVTTIATRLNGEMALYHADVRADSERPAAEALALHVGRTLHVAEASDEEILANLAQVTWFNDLPLIYQPNAVPFYLVCRRAGKDGIKVLLTGEGSDEYFVGYPTHALSGSKTAVAGIKQQLQRRLHAILPRAGRFLWPSRSEDHAHLLRGMITRHEETAVTREAEDAFGFLRPAQRRLHVISLKLAQEHLLSLLHRNDRLGMAWGLESRFPFLGHGLARLAVNLPARYKLRITRRAHDRRHPFVVDKWIVRAIAAQEVPAMLARRPKQGFPVSLYARLNIGIDAFENGFVPEAFGLDRRALASTVETATPQWLTRLLLLEIWGQLFVNGRRAEDLREGIVRAAARR